MTRAAPARARTALMSEVRAVTATGARLLDAGGLVGDARFGLARAGAGSADRGSGRICAVREDRSRTWRPQVLRAADRLVSEEPAPAAIPAAPAGIDDAAGTDDAAGLDAPLQRPED